jgi:hypothetical protein
MVVVVITLTRLFNEKIRIGIVAHFPLGLPTVRTYMYLLYVHKYAPNMYLHTEQVSYNQDEHEHSLSHSY